MVGNIGIPYTSEAATMTDETVTVAEISSFQLETIHEFRPDVSAILNITAGSSEPSSYDGVLYQDKRRRLPAIRQTVRCVYSIMRMRCFAAFGESAPAKVVWFSSAQKTGLNGFYLDGRGNLTMLHDGNTEYPGHQCQ